MMLNLFRAVIDRKRNTNYEFRLALYPITGMRLRRKWIFALLVLLLAGIGSVTGLIIVGEPFVQRPLSEAYKNKELAVEASEDDLGNVVWVHGQSETMADEHRQSSMQMRQE